MRNKFWICFRYATIALFVLCAVLSAFEGEWYQAFLQGMVAALFVIISINENLIESTLAGWETALAGWMEANQQNSELKRALEEADDYKAGGSYEPYGFSKRDQD